MGNMTDQARQRETIQFYIDRVSLATAVAIASGTLTQMVAGVIVAAIVGMLYNLLEA